MHKGGFLNIFLILAAISLLFDWYVFNGLKTFTADRRSKAGKHIVPWGFLVISVGITVVFLLGFSSYNTSKGMTPFHEWMLSLFLTFLLPSWYLWWFCFWAIWGVVVLVYTMLPLNVKMR
ncbi:hypothetical protein [Mucilaginibacter humi]|uniref:hypothetical protein n=1 Tax=Mucilaginibacter humi TaxID=2732510 RepID=UPI001FE6FB73|nr:hypothetical protein [Mucilaginibacter humi]